MLSTEERYSAHLIFQNTLTKYFFFNFHIYIYQNCGLNYQNCTEFITLNDHFCLCDIKKEAHGQHHLPEEQ